jgi:hypothetical protein
MHNADAREREAQKRYGSSFKALDEDLPGLVRAHVQKALPDLAQPFITGSIAKSVGGGDRFDERLESHERRISRGADHLQRIEERLRKLEGKA